RRSRRLHRGDAGPPLELTSPRRQLEATRQHAPTIPSLFGMACAQTTWTIRRSLKRRLILLPQREKETSTPGRHHRRKADPGALVVGDELGRGGRQTDDEKDGTGDLPAADDEIIHSSTARSRLTHIDERAGDGDGQDPLIVAAARAPCAEAAIALN